MFPMVAPLRWGLHLALIVLLGLVQFLVVWIIPGESVFLQIYNKQDLLQHLQQPPIYLWLWMNILVGWNLWPWWQRGYLPRKTTFLLWLSVGMWLAFAWGWGWFHHLRSPEPWYKHHLSLLQHFVCEGLIPVGLAFSTVSGLLLMMSVWATWLWTRRSSRHLRWFWLGILWFGVCSLFLHKFVPHASSVSWLLVVIGTCWTLQCLVLTTFPLPISSTSSTPLQPGWRDLDEVTRSQHLTPTPLAALVLPVLTILCTCLVTYFTWIIASPLAQTPHNSTSSLNATFAQWLHSYRIHRTLLDDLLRLSWLCLLSMLPGIILIGLRYQAVFFAMRKAYWRTLSVAIPVILGIVTMAILYSHTAGQLVFSHHPSEAYNIMHSLQQYRQPPLSPSISTQWGEIRPPLRQHRLHELALFPLPLIRLGEQYTVVHISERWITVGQGWQFQRIPCKRIHTHLPPPQTHLSPPPHHTNTPKQRQSQRKATRDMRTLHRVLQENATSQRKSRQGIARTTALLVLSPHASNTVTYRVLQALQQHRFTRIFLVIGTPQLWFHGNMQMPFLASARFIPLVFSNPIPPQTAKQDAPPSIQIPLLPDSTVYSWVTKLVASLPTDRPTDRLTPRPHFVPQPSTHQKP